MFSVFVILLLIVGAALVYTRTSTSKLAFRIRGLFNRSKDQAADKLGNIVHDREQKIVERKQVNAKFREQMGAIKADILIHTKQHQRALEEAEKYADLAMAAVKQGNDAAAREALELKRQKETLASTLLTTVETCEQTFDELNKKYAESTEEVRLAESNQASFKAEYGSLALRRKMQESAQAFGGIGNLDFSSSEADLEKMRAEVQAFDEVDAGSNVLKKLEKQVQKNEVEQELQALKKKKNVKLGQKLKYNGMTYTVRNDRQAFTDTGLMLDLTDFLLLNCILSQDNYCDHRYIESPPVIEHQLQEPVYHTQDYGGSSYESHSYDSGGSFDSGGGGDCGGYGGE